MDKESGSEKKLAKAKKTAEKVQAAKEVSTSRIMLESALGIIKRSNLRVLLLYVDGLEDPTELEILDFSAGVEIILIVHSEESKKLSLEFTDKVVQLPAIQLTRTGQIKMGVMLAFSKRMLKPNDKFVFLTGLPGGQLDTMMMMEVGREYEMFQSVGQPPLTEHIRRAVFERVLNLALELAAEGREGKPLGAIFVLGSSKEVQEHTQQNIINPFRGYPESERNIMDSRMKETVKEFASIDGAFVIKGTGTIVSAGTYLQAKLMPEELPQGLGARHAAAAAITAATKSIAITISESTGTVRIWRQGQLITEIEKAKRTSSEVAGAEPKKG